MPPSVRCARERVPSPRLAARVVIGVLPNRAMFKIAESPIPQVESAETPSNSQGQVGETLALCWFVKVREIVAMLEALGWIQVKQVGSHRQFKHAQRRGRVTVSGHDGSDLPLGTLRSIYRQAGLDWRSRDK